MSDDGRSDTGGYRFVANFECGNCGYETTKKMRVKAGSFTDECDGCGEESEFSATMDPMDINKFGEELIPR